MQEQAKKNIDLNAEQSLMFHISAQDNYTSFQSRLQYSFI